ncbi:hypothetical protein [Halorhodospira halochloris]|nr:hypothetical protein [Halorhodospira halochloris]
MSSFKWLRVTGAVLAGGVIAGCTSSSGFVNYDERQMYSGETAGNIEFLEIGPISANSRSFLWTSCHQMVTEVADELRAEAKEAGGNAIINVRWRDYDSGEWVRHPACTTAWGWSALAPPVIGAVWPWAKRSGAEGIAVYADESQIEHLRESIREYRGLLVDEYFDDADAEEALFEGDAVLEEEYDEEEDALEEPVQDEAEIGDALEDPVQEEDELEDTDQGDEELGDQDQDEETDDDPEDDEGADEDDTDE